MIEILHESTINVAVDRVQRAFVDGRIDEPELERRLDLILTATGHAQLRLALEGLPAAPVPAATPAPVRNQDHPASALIHLSGLISGPILPGVAHLASQPGSPARRASTDALNFQLLSVGIFVATMLLGWLGLGAPRVVWGLTWAALTIVAAVKAHRGKRWENPLTRLTGFRPVDEDSLPALRRPEA